MTSTPRARRPRMTIIHRLDEIPPFTSETEEHEYWGTHALSEELMDSLPLVPDELLPPPRPDTYPVGLRLTAEEIKRLKALAERRHTDHRRMMRKWVLERLEEEELKSDDCSEVPRASGE